MRECKNCGMFFAENLKNCPDCGAYVANGDGNVAEGSGADSNFGNNTSAGGFMSLKTGEDTYKPDNNGMFANSMNNYNAPPNAFSGSNTGYTVPVNNNQKGGKLVGIIVAIVLLLFGAGAAMYFLNSSSAGEGFKSKEAVVEAFSEAFASGDLEGYMSIYPQGVRDNMSSYEISTMEQSMAMVSNGDIQIEIDDDYSFTDASSSEKSMINNSLKAYDSSIRNVGKCMKVTLTMTMSYGGYSEDADFSLYVFKIGNQWYGCDPME